jgi:transcriptional regulator with XRE-family HTH domain
MNELLPKRLRELRKENKYTQEEMAKKLGVTTSAYGFYEQGRIVPDTLKILELANMFNVTTDYLLGLSEDKKPIEDITERQKKAIRMTDQLTDEQFKSILEMVLSFKKD